MNDFFKFKMFIYDVLLLEQQRTYVIGYMNMLKKSRVRFSKYDLYLLVQDKNKIEREVFNKFCEYCDRYVFIPD